MGDQKNKKEIYSHKRIVFKQKWLNYEIYYKMDDL